MDQSLPKFQVYAKRKNAKQKKAHIYLRITYKTDALDKSLGIECKFASWLSHTESIKNEPVLTHQLREKLMMIKQKILGDFYILK